MGIFKNRKPKKEMTSEQKELFKRAKKVQKLPKDGMIKGQLFRMNINPAKGVSKDGRAKNLKKREAVYEFTGKEGFGKFTIKANREK